MGTSTSGISGDKSESNWGGVDYWIIKIDSSGVKQWDKRYGGSNNDDLMSFFQTSDKGYMLGGFSASGISGDKTQPVWGSYDYWIVKTDSLGTIQWDKDFGGTDNEYFYGNVSPTNDNGFLLSGISKSPISGDKTENNMGYQQAWIVKTDSMGAKQWDKTIFTNGTDDQSFAIETMDGCYTMAISTSAGIGGYKTQPSWGPWDYWLVKFCDTTFTTFAQQLLIDNSPFSIYPNPTTSTFTIESELEKAELKIYDVTGRVAYSTTLNSKHQTLNPKLGAGVYFVELSEMRQGGMRAIQKLIVQ